MTRRLLAGSVCAFLAVSPVNAKQLRSTSFEPCPDLLAAATKLRDYRVRKVAINTPFDFLRTVRNMLDRLTARLPQQADQPFVDADVSNGAALIQDEFGAGVDGVGAPFKLTVVTAVVDNCRSVGEARELDVVYSVYSTEIPFFSARTFESVEKNRRDPMQGVGVAEGQTPRVRPRLAYDRSTKLRAGADVEVVDVGLLDRLTLGAEGSSESHLVNAATAGGWDVGRSWLQRLDWHTEYRYSDQPTEGGGLTRNRAIGHISFLLRNVGSGPHLRTGVSVEGGHLESELDAGMVPADNLVNTPYTAIKGYVGATLRRRRHSFVASYGVQLGATDGGMGSGFRKHIGDAAYRGRFLPRDHFPVEVDLHLAGGRIENLGGLPVTERFFGGTVQQDFVQGDEWRIRANPVIRSFAQNRLARVGKGPPIGGESFVALNLTVAPTIWGRSLVPQELQDEETLEILDGQLNSAEMVLRADYKSRDPAISDETLSGLADQLQALRVAFEAIQDGFSDAAPDVLEENAETFMICREDTVIVAAEESATLFDGTPAERYFSLTDLIDSYLPDIRACVERLPGVVGARLHPALEDATRAEAAIRERFLSRIDTGRAEAKAADDIEYPRNVLDTFFHELNLASIAPVFMFDAARLGSRADQDASGLRFGLGGGIRFSLVSLAHVTVAYVFNTDPMPWEDRGAFFASLEVSDLFD